MGDPIGFGVELRRRRLAAGLSLTHLAASLHYSKGYLSKIETGLKKPPPDLARRCDTVLDARGALAALAPAHASEPEPGDAIVDGEAWLMVFSDGAGWFRPVHRREALAAGAASALVFGVNGLTAPATAHDAAPTGLLRELFAYMRRLGQVSSPALLLPVLIAQTHAITQLAARAAAPTRDELLVLAARYAEYTGWMAQESGNDQSALWWTQRAVEMADAGGDQNLADYAQVRKALIALYRDDATETIRLASRVRRESPPRIRLLAAQREAQGHALAGDYDSCMRSLDQARALTSPAGTRLTATPLTLGSTNLLDPVTMVAGWCLYDLGRLQAAANLLDHECARLPADALRTRARFGVRRAMAHAAAGEISHACELTGQLLDVVDAIDSATVAIDLRRLARVFARFRAHPAVRELSPRLTAALHRPQH